VFVHFLIENLITSERRWRIGPAVLWPPGALREHLDSEIAAAKPPWLPTLAEMYLRDLAEPQWSTLSVPVLAPEGPLGNAIADQARDTARDVVAVLRLLQRVRVPMADVTFQTFGLGTDIGPASETRWVTARRGRIAGIGFQHHGIIGSWTFRDADRRAYRKDPRFAFLDAALAAGDGGRDDWQSRVIAAARTASLATILQRPSTRIVLLATALEALLGNAYRPGARPTGSHVLAKRAAYLWCGTDMTPPSPHGTAAGARPACDLLTTTSDPRGDPNLWHARRGIWACSWYGDMRQLYEDRNAALHGAEARVDHSAASSHQRHLEAVILATVAWVIRASPTSIDDLDREIAALPAA
jgi:hypothetical protein